MTSLLTSPSSTSTDGLGAQRPRVHKFPPYGRSLGGEVIDFMAQVGKPLDEWQQLMVLDTFGLRPDGYWAAFECVGLVSRQNGKGGYTEAVELGGLFLFGDQIIMHSAHLFKTAKQSFQRLIDIIDGSDWLTKRVAKVVRSRGDEEILLTRKAGAGRFLCFSRAGGAGRGFTGDKTVFDECAYLTIEQYQAATPTLATVPNPQIIYTGTPPDEDVGPMLDDAMMPSVRKRGHAGGDRIALWEWSPPKGFDRTDPAVWAACNPAMGNRIAEWFLAKQLDNFSAAGKPEKFDTEHLGVWPAEPGAQWAVISEDHWNDAEDPDSVLVDPMAFAVTLSTDRQWASIAVAGARPDGLVHVELADRRPGTGWVVERLVELRERWKPCAVVLDAGSPAGSLLAAVEEAGIEVTKPTARDVAAAAGAFYDGVCGQRAPDSVTGELGPDPRVIRHRGQDELTTAVAGALKRPLGAAWAWDQLAASTDIAPLIACSNALWGYATRPAPADVWAFSS